MADRSDILVVAATTRELAPAQGWQTLACGVGPVEAAAHTAAALVATRPRAVLHVGIAGARRQPATFGKNNLKDFKKISVCQFTSLELAEEFRDPGGKSVGRITRGHENIMNFCFLVILNR